MAPEQDDPLAVVDLRADVYGLGRLGAKLLCAPAAAGSPAPLRFGVPAPVADVLHRATAHRSTVTPTRGPSPPRWPGRPPPAGLGRRPRGGAPLAAAGVIGALAPALVMSPRPDRWASDPAVAGAFVGWAEDDAARRGPAAFVAELGHRNCVAAPVQNRGLAGVVWVVAAFSSCAPGKPVLIEAAAAGPAGGLIYVQIAPPVGSGPDFVDTLLAGVRVRAR